MASRKLETLAPVFLARVVEWLADCAAEKLEILVYRTRVEAWEQADVYKVGRTRKGEGVSEKRPMGRIITKSKPGQSAHQYGLAIDFVPLLPGGKAGWNSKALYDKAIALASERGMESLRPFELAHLQIKNFNWREHKK